MPDRAGSCPPACDAVRVERLGENTRRPRTGAAVALVFAGWLAGCSSPAPDPLTSSPEQAFEIVEHDGDRYAVGHGVTLQLPDTWTDYEPESVSADGRAYEWAVGRPVEDGVFPSGLQLSMGRPGAGPSLGELREAAHDLAELAPSYELVGEGEAEVAGAEHAAYLRLLRDKEYDGRTVRVEQVTLMVEVADGTTSTVRFISPAGEWEEQMEDVYESLRVAVADDGS